MQYSIWQSAGKGLKLHGGFWGPGGTCFAQVLKPSTCRISTWQGKGKGRWQSAGKGLKLHGGFWGPGGTCFAQVLKPSKCRISTWQGRGKVRKVHRRVSCPSDVPGAGVETRLNAIFDLAKRWQRIKAARRVLGPWWNVLRAGFETLSKCSIATWQGKAKGDGKALARG